MLLWHQFSFPAIFVDSTSMTNGAIKVPAVVLRASQQTGTNPEAKCIGINCSLQFRFGLQNKVL